MKRVLFCDTELVALVNRLHKQHLFLCCEQQMAMHKSIIINIAYFYFFRSQRVLLFRNLRCVL